MTEETIENQEAPPPENNPPTTEPDVPQVSCYGNVYINSFHSVWQILCYVLWKELTWLDVIISTSIREILLTFFVRNLEDIIPPVLHT